jgi:transcriptional regulator with XRE-family HTH domain
MSWLSELGDQIREARMARGMSQQELSNHTSVSRAQIGNIEKGKSAPAANIVAEIANALDTDLRIAGHRLSRVGDTKVPSTNAIPVQLRLEFEVEYGFRDAALKLSSVGDRNVELTIRFGDRIA